MAATRQRHSAESLIRRFEALKSERSQWSDFYSDVRDYLRPNKATIDDFRTPGQRTGRKLFDSTGPNSQRDLALVFASSLTNRNTQWFTFAIPETGPFANYASNERVQNWLNVAARTLFNALGESNFYNVINEIYLDFVSFATCCLYSEESSRRSEGFRGLNFRALPINSYVMAEDDHGLVDTVGREYTFTARQAKQRWPNAELPDKIEKALLKEPDKSFEFIRFVMPREDWRPGSPFSTDAPYALIDIACEGKKIINESGFFEFPYHVGRYDKASGETRGRGPADVAMGDIKSLNKLRELELRGYRRAVEPPILAGDNTIIGRARMQPNAITYARDITQIKQLPPNFRMDMSSLKADQLIQSIRDVYLTDQIVLPRTKTMTAEEVATLREQLNGILGPTVERFQDEVLEKALERSFGIMTRAGAMPAMPEELQGIERLEIVYNGSLARNQKLEIVRSVRNWIGMVQELSILDPRLKNVVNLEKVARLSAPMLGVPEEFQNDDRTTKRLNAADDERAAMANEMALAEQGSNALKNVTPLIQESANA